jgi:3-deoxy-manno-octulosonate cytidylyltransferase (CMP-KDO synthetase)
MAPMDPVAIIPARYGSQRLPGKPLLDLGGKPIIRHVYDRAREAGIFSRILVATDSSEIYRTVLDFGGEAVMTAAHHRSGTDRIAEVARGIEATCVINIQGDEPFLRPEMLRQLWDSFKDEQEAVVGTLQHPLSRGEDLLNPSVVKVVTDQNGYALYFSRAPIPYPGPGGTAGVERGGWYKHVGVYAYRRDFLIAYPSLPRQRLEEVENLEQLRVLAHGYRIRVYTTPWETLGIDTEADLIKARSQWSARQETPS